MIPDILKIRKRTLRIWLILILSNSSFLLSQPQNITTPMNEGVTPERDFSYYNRIYFENSLKQSVDSNLTLISHLGIGPCYDAVPTGNYVFVGNGALFQVLDVSDPLIPTLIGEVLIPTGYITDIEIYGNFALVVGPLTIIDITNLSDPIITYIQPIGMFELFIDDHYAYVGGFSDITILDIINPSSPINLGSFSIRGEIVSSIAVYGNYLYTTSLLQGFFIDIYDINDKSNPMLMNYYFGTGSLYIKYNYLYNGSIGEFKIYEIIDSSSINNISGIPINGTAEELILEDTLGYLSLVSKGEAIINISNRYNPFVLTYITPVNSPVGYLKCGIENTFAYISSGSGFDIFNMENPESPVYISTYLTSWEITKMKIYNNQLYASGTYCGLKIIDYSSATGLKVVGQYQEKNKVLDFDVFNQNAFLLSDHSVLILDIQNPTTPYKINEISFPDTIGEADFGSILVKDSILIVSLPTYHLSVINVSDPLNPFLIDSIVTSRRIHDLAIKYDCLFSAEGFDGFHIYKIDVPLNEVYAIDSVTFTTLVESHFAYTHTLGASIYNITNPNLPEFAGYSFTPGSRGRVESSKSDDYLSFAYNLYLEIIDVSDPYNPFTAAYSRGESYHSVAAVNNLIFAGNELRGIKVFKNDLISSVDDSNNENVTDHMHLIQNFPNPFNNTTTIKYFIPETNFIKLKLYDILGNEIKTIDEGWRSSGYHSIELNTEEYSSGVYIYTLTNKTTSISRKMLLLK